MSIESRRIIDEENNDSTVALQRSAHFGTMVQHTSSVMITLRQLQTELQDQHQHDKDALIELNQRFQIFIDRIQSLQSQNAKYLAAIADLRRQLTGISTSDIEQNYYSSRTSLSSVFTAKIDYEWDWELYRLQSDIYQRLIDLQQQSKDRRIVKLEEELKQSNLTLNTLRSSYEQLQRGMENIYAENADLARQYLALTHEWCNMRKQRKKWDLSLETLKSYIGFYRNLRSNFAIETRSAAFSSEDSQQFWALELDKIVQRIRHDFEAFYGSIYQQMLIYYETKGEELETNVQQAVHYQQIEMEKVTVVQQKLHLEYEKVQTSLTYEREVYAKLENALVKFEGEFDSIQLQNQEQLEAQGDDLQMVQDGIVNLAYDVEEIRRRKSILEVEIIIYRQLLNAAGIEAQTLVPPPPPRTQPTATGVATGNFIIKSQRKGFVGIKMCAPNGSYVSLMNASTNIATDISRWVLAKTLDTGTKFRYTIPDGVRLDPGRELRIYAKINGGGSGGGPGESTSYQKLVNSSLRTWGESNVFQTVLFNQHGEEEASYSQTSRVQRI